MVEPLDHMGSVLVISLLFFYVFLTPMVYVFVHMCCVGHAGSGVTMGIPMVLLSTCGHVCMIDYVLFMFMYGVCTLAYILLHVYAFLVYARSPIGHVCVVSVYDFLCDVIC